MSNKEFETMQTSDSDLSAREIADRIKQIAQNIRESSLKVQGTLKVLRESGAILELASAVQTAAIASRDIANEVSRAASELRESGLVKGTASAIEGTTTAALDTAETLKGTSADIKNSMPNTSSTLEKASREVKKVSTGSKQ